VALVDEATRGAVEADGAARGVVVVARGAVEVDGATRGAGRRASGGVGVTHGAGEVNVAARGAANGARRGSWGGGVSGSDSEGVEIGGWGGACKGKRIFVEDDVARDDDAVGGEVKAAIPLVVRGVAEEEAEGGAGG
jgi:hypothetical protein